MAQPVSTLAECPSEVLIEILAALNETSSMKSIHESSRQFRELAKPFVFQSVSIKGNWLHALEQIEDMAQSPDTIKHIQSFTFHLIDATFSQFKSKKLQITDLLIRLPKLNQLELSLLGNNLPIFQSMFCEVTTTLPTIETLILGQYTETVIRLCPHVKTIKAIGTGWGGGSKHKLKDALWVCNPVHRLINKAAMAPKLSHFALLTAWNSDLLEFMLKAMPELTLSVVNEISYDELESDLIKLLARIKRIWGSGASADLEFVFHTKDVSNH